MKRKIIIALIVVAIVVSSVFLVNHMNERAVQRQLDQATQDLGDAMLDAIDEAFEEHKDETQDLIDELQRIAGDD